MFSRLIEKISGDYNQKQISKIQPLVDQINEYYESRHSLTDAQIQAKTDEFRARIEDGESLDDLLPEAYATVKQACKRMVGMEIEVKGDTLVWEMIPYDVQLIGGIMIHQGKMAEMRTGEGKTLVATLPCYLNALTGKGVHVVTVNDYLASRDAEWMAYLYNRLGLTVGSVVKGVPIQTRREQYSKDITYVENSELGFDYLRDNLAKTLEERNMIWRPLHYAIIDEVDSILIDEARTPLIISQPSSEPTEKYDYYAQIVKTLVPAKGKKKVSKGFLAELMKDDKEDENIDDQTGDYYVEEKTKSVTLSTAGIMKLEKMLNIDHLYKDLGYGEIHHIENALKAQAVYNKDKEYLVRDGQVMIVDDHTGRVMPGRRFSQGLHQAIEAKEKVAIQKESTTMASITYQNFFKQYQKLSGMTGTALTEAEEFEKIYETETVTIPTNKPILRVDKTDEVYFNQDAKRKAIVDHISFYHRIGVPMLIGTSSIQTSELVSQILNKGNIPHFVLNAKFHEQEANIVKNAGSAGSVVVATNMAGRGTDIKLKKELNTEIALAYARYMRDIYESGKMIEGVVYSELEAGRLNDALLELGVESSMQVHTKRKDTTEPYATVTVGPAGSASSAEDVEVRNLHFGLFILGTEKHESRRIDNQLRGRAGRQGDPGVSQFFVALDDEIMRKMGGDKIQSIARMMLGKEELESMAFTQKQFTSSIERAQKQMEGRHFGIRKHLFDYDNVINKQRIRVYAKRDEILGLGESGEPYETSPQTPLLKGEGLPADGRGDGLDVRGEVQGSIAEIVDELVTLHASYKPRNVEELSESLEQVMAISILPEELTKQGSVKNLRAFLVMHLEEVYELKFDPTAAVDSAGAGVASMSMEELDALDTRQRDLIKKIMLTVIDKHRVEHIDEMSYLREKVSLRSYAQQDPLVIYKKEAYEKFQSFLKTIKKETLSTVMRAQFVAPVAGVASVPLPTSPERRGVGQDATPAGSAALDDIVNQLMGAGSESQMMDILEKVAGQIPAEAVTAAKQHIAQSGISDAEVVSDVSGDGVDAEVISLDSGESAKVISADDEFEVLEISSPESSPSQNEGVEVIEVVSPARTKLRPNDKVNVQYPDGKIEYSVKWKKVKKSVEKGECKVVG